MTSKPVAFSRPAQFDVLKASRGENPWTDPTKPSDIKAMVDRHTILATIAGSRLFGTNLDDDADFDEYAVAIEPPELALSFDDGQAFTSYRHATNNGGTTHHHDRTTFSLRHFFKLAAKGDAHQLTMLYVPATHIIAKTALGDELVAGRHRFLSRKIIQAFYGYARSTMERYVDGPSGRAELIANYGYDTKAAMHAVRVLIQGCELLATHHITLPMHDANLKQMLAIRTGEITKKEIDALVAHWSDRLTHWGSRTSLPQTPDHVALHAWLATLYRKHWRIHDDMVTKYYNTL